MRRFVGLLAAAMIASTAEAQVPNNGSDMLQAFTRSPFYAGLLNNALSALPPAVFRRCPALVSAGSRVTILAPVTFGADGFPNGGRWLQRIPVSGCGNDTVLNLFFQATAAEKIDTIIGNPGGTLADPILQRDALRYALAGVAAAGKECRNAVVTTTRFQGYGWQDPPKPDPGAGVRLRPWWETWTLVGCGQTYDVPVDFAPDDKGTQITQPGHITGR